LQNSYWNRTQRYKQVSPKKPIFITHEHVRVGVLYKHVRVGVLYKHVRVGVLWYVCIDDQVLNQQTPHNSIQFYSLTTQQTVISLFIVSLTICVTCVSLTRKKRDEPRIRCNGY